MKTFLFPAALFMLLAAFMVQLPNLKYCVLPPENGASRRIDCRDFLIMAVITLLYAMIAFHGLGSRVAPQTFAYMGGFDVAFELNGEDYPSRIMYYSGVGEGKYLLDFSTDGEHWQTVAEISQNYEAVLKWHEYLPQALQTPKYIRFSGSGAPYLGEIVAYNGDGERMNLMPYGDKTCSALLVDEQETAVTGCDFLNSSYFDEIYHARTAWEHINNVRPYEVSHPPLGKLIIGLGIRLFGMTPFGWRFMGTLFGVLMLPLMYVFIKKLFGGRGVPTACTVVFASDFMHFVQTRIATIDTYGVFFTLLMYFFMYMFIAEDKKRNAGTALICLALSGVSFGLGAASKWTGVYAGAGLAVLWVLFWIFNRKRGLKAFAKNSAFCIVFFVIVPAAIYYVSYYPYGLAEGMSGVGMLFSRRYADIVLNNQQFMFFYHSGLVSEHPYSSMWYQWILDIRPILYYLESYSDGMRSSFGAFVNPVLCWGGLLCLFVLLFTAICRRDKCALFILIAYLAQLIPWIFVSRLTFEYHYFPCSVFLVLALGYVFSLLQTDGYRWQINIGGFAAVSVLLFVLFYPALSGKPVNETLAKQLLHWLPTWPF